MSGLLKNLFGTKEVVKEIQAPAIEFVECATSGQELPSEDFKGHVKLGILVGHERGKPGAVMPRDAGGLTEYNYNSGVANEMKAYVKRKYPQMEVVIIMRDGIGRSGAYKKAISSLCDCVIELHFNAFNTKAYGTETLCTPDVSDVAFAKTIQHAMVALFKRQGRGDRGILPISKAARGGGNVHSFPGGVNCLVEPAFGDNLAEANMLLTMRDKYAWCLVDAVYLWAKQAGLIKPT
jgi:N-acetylmuramoyl-L-alanine amidase